MPKLSPTRIVSIIIFFYSLLVIAGWIFNIDFFIRILPGSQPMAFVTALSFLLSSIALWFIEDAMEGKTEVSLVVLTGTTLTTLLLMTTIIAASVFGAYTGITDLFLAGNAVFSAVSPGMPAIMTVLGFVCFDAISIHSLFIDTGNMNKTIIFLEAAMVIIGLIAILGYISGVPLLMYQFTKDSTPMALNTAISFVFLGTAVFFIEKNRNKK